jgi:hypothetical protein
MVLLKAYKSNEGYIGKIDPSELSGGTDTNVKFIVILDRSGSMGSNVKKFVNTILPRVLEKLNMKNVDIDLIDFDDGSRIYTGDSNYFENLRISMGGCTYMHYAVQNLDKLLQNYTLPNVKQNIRLLSISDGMLHDQLETLNLASDLFSKIKDSFTINSQAIRLFTSSCEPDTRGLSSMLQFNTISTPQLIDIDANNSSENITDSIVELFINDGLNFKITLKSSDKIFKENPWNDSYESIDLIKGENVFWMDDVPKSLTIESDDNGEKSTVEVPVEMGEDLTMDNYRRVLESKIDYFMKKIRVLKVVNTQSSLEEMKTIIQYFEKFESYLESSSENLDDIDTIKLNNRVHLLKKLIQKRDCSITNMMKEIQNNDKVNQLNSRQLADFLRNVNTDKDGKSLSRRGLAEGINFDTEARKEVLEMAKHLDEIKDIDDTDHTVSFYSHATTLDGIKTVCELTEDPDIFEKITAIDIIKLLNIVGVGCDAFIGNFTDPMIYRLKEIYLGCYISLSDVLSASEYSGGKNNLVDFSTRRTIVNVIPVFDDQRIHKFLLKYAPKLLEYTASIGMRRVLMEVPYTYEFLFEAGILKFCQTLNETKTEAAINLFSQLIESYQIASGNHYNYINNVITKQIENYPKDPKQYKYQIYLEDQPVAAMTSVFINMFKNGEEKMLPKVLRHLFCHEVHKVVNKIVKSKDQCPDFCNDYLKDLLGIDLEKNGTPLPELFKTDENPDIYDQYTINKEKLDEIFNQAYGAMYIPFTPYYIKATQEDDKLTAFKNLKEFNVENVKEYLAIDYDFETFKAFAVIQAFLFRKNENRLDTETKTMKIIDIVHYDNANAMVKNYVKNIYKEDYNKRYAEQLKKEQDVLGDELIDQLLMCDDITTYKDGFQKGLTRGQTTVNIDNIYSPIFLKLKSQIENKYKTLTIPLLFEKIAIIILGRDENDDIVWNKGNICRTDITELKNILMEIDSERYEPISEEIKKRNIHIYRELQNRHGHSNDLPSYWALGYPTLEIMFANVSQEEIDEYKRLHVGCCGL